MCSSSCRAKPKKDIVLKEKVQSEHPSVLTYLIHCGKCPWGEFTWFGGREKGGRGTYCETTQLFLILCIVRTYSRDSFIVVQFCFLPTFGMRCYLLYLFTFTFSSSKKNVFYILHMYNTCYIKFVLIGEFLHSFCFQDWRESWNL